MLSALFLFLRLCEAEDDDLGSDRKTPEGNDAEAKLDVDGSQDQRDPDEPDEQAMLLVEPLDRFRGGRGDFLAAPLDEVPEDLGGLEGKPADGAKCGEDCGMHLLSFR